ncbi:hypothetical protein RAS1_07330 [Phycisphaerae bacterium RAS1]|nr:hypothetical protein RAS1_07330 [Phycisphaerae bacterium RAS1]
MDHARHTGHTSPASRGAPTGAVWLGVGLGVLLTLGAGVALTTVASRLGLVQELRTGVKPFQIDKSARSEVRQALALHESARRFTLMLQDPASVGLARSDIQRMLEITISSQLGRLLHAAIALHDLESSAAPPESWANSVQPFFDGLEHASFRHMQSDLREHLAAAGERAGMTAGSARRMGMLLAASPLGPFLQYFTAAQFRAADALRERGAAALAAAMDRPALGLLREWIIEPGAPSLRMLAADLLAQRLETEAAGDAPRAELAKLLRDWRTAYRAVFDQRKPPITIISNNREPDVCPELHAPVERWLTIAVWTLLGGALSAVAAALTVWSLWTRPSSQLDAGAARLDAGAATQPIRFHLVRLLLGVIGGAAFVLLGFVWYHFNPQVMHDDWSRDFTARGGWPRGPLLAAAIAVLLLAAVLLMGRSDRWRRLTTVASGAWCGLLAAAIAFLLITSAYYSKYDACVAQRLASMEKDPILGGDGKLTAAVIDKLRAWTP